MVCEYSADLLFELCLVLVYPVIDVLKEPKLRRLDQHIGLYKDIFGLPEGYSSSEEAEGRVRTDPAKTQYFSKIMLKAARDASDSEERTQSPPWSNRELPTYKVN